jgi:hypothetical protein
MPISETVRSELIRRARDKHRRQNLFKTAEPCDWRPRQVLHPEAGIPFTDVGAWNFIADLLESGHEVNAIEMDKPPGQIGYVILANGYEACPSIYVKLTLTANMVNGRSFHDSEYEK